MNIPYDETNVFARLLRQDIPAEVIHESQHCIAFKDIRPQAPVHLLLIPKGRYVCYDQFAAEASDEEMLDFTRTLGRLCNDHGLSAEVGGDGYRLITNSGADGFQEVPHLHFHIVGGRFLGPLLPESD